MRVATEEEDILLQRISSCEREIYNLENEVMLCEYQAKGYREKRRQLTVKFFAVVLICAIFVFFSFGFLVNFSVNPALTTALYLGSGGLGIFALIDYIYTAVFLVKYFAAISKSQFWSDLSEKIGVENIEGLELANLAKLTSYKEKISSDKELLKESCDAYFILKEKNDKIFEEEVASGKRKADFNFDAYSSYVEVTNEWINYNKLRVEHLKLVNRKKVLEKDAEDMIIYEDKCKESIVWFLVLTGLLIFTIIALAFSTIFHSDLVAIIRMAIVFFIMIFGIVSAINLVNFITKLPYISDSKFSDFIADKLGIDHTKKDLKNMLAEIENSDLRIKELSNEIASLKEEMSRDKEENMI